MKIKEVILDRINLWSTIGGLIGVLLVYPYLGWRVTEMGKDLDEKAQIREEKREQERIAREEAREEMRTIRFETALSQLRSDVNKWGEDFNDALPQHVDSLIGIEVDSRLLRRIPVRTFRDGTLISDKGYEYYADIDGKLIKIEVDK